MAHHNISINNSTGFNNDLLCNETRKIQSKHFYARPAFIWVLSVIEIPVMILTLIALCSLIKSHRAASVLISNLILSDLILAIYMLISATITLQTWKQIRGEYYYFLIVGLYFMACVAFERYLLVSHPIWYKSHHSLKLSCFISLIIWFVPLIFAKIEPPHINFRGLPRCIACLIPYPIIILCFAGTWRGLSHSISLTSLKRKLILGSLFLVLLTYTFLILPFVILDFIRNYFDKNVFVLKSYFYVRMLLFVNPLADCLLYLFIRPDVGNLIKSIHCCCRHQSSKLNQDEHSVVNPQNSCTSIVCCISAQKPASHSLNTCSSV